MWEKDSMYYKTNRLCQDQIQAATREVHKKFKKPKLKETPITRELCVQMLQWREKKKLDVLSELSNPFKPKKEQTEMVIELQYQKCLLADNCWRKFGFELEEFEQAAFFYDLMKPDSEDPEIHRNALVIQN